jgi:hypothetical protein
MLAAPICENPRFLESSTAQIRIIASVEKMALRHIQTDDDRCRFAQPPTRRRARDSQVRRYSHVPGALDQIPKPVVVALLRTGDGWQGNDHRRFRHTALNPSRTMRGLRRRHDNWRSKVRGPVGTARQPSQTNHVRQPSPIGPEYCLSQDKNVDGTSFERLVKSDELQARDGCKREEIGIRPNLRG